VRERRGPATEAVTDADPPQQKVSSVTVHLPSELNELRQVKDQTDKMLDLFQLKNMVEAKKLINKASSEVQKIV
jgi:hypothetical protein